MRAASAQARRVVRFGVFELDIHCGELRRSGVRVNLQDQPGKLLECLLEHPGVVVTREELRQRKSPKILDQHQVSSPAHKLAVYNPAIQSDGKGSEPAAPCWNEDVRQRGESLDGARFRIHDVDWCVPLGGAGCVAGHLVNAPCSNRKSRVGDTGNGNAWRAPSERLEVQR